MLGLAVPLALAQIAHIALQTTDVIMIGWLGPQALASVSLGFNLYMPLWLFGLGLAVAVAPMAAQALGARDFQGVRRSVRQGFWVTTVVSVPFCLLLWQGEAILLAFGQKQANAAGAQDYLRAALWGFAPSLWFTVLRSFASAQSRPRSLIVVTLAGIVVNALGNYVLIFGHFGFPALGLAGAGISTTIVNCFMFLGLLAFMQWDWEFSQYTILKRLWRPDWQRFLEVLRIGLPIGATIVAESTLFASAGLLMGLIGTKQLAAHAIALQCASVAFMVPLGVSQAATVRVALAAGAGNTESVGRAGWVAIAIGCGFTLIPAFCFWFLPRELAGLYLDLSNPDNRAVIGFAVAFLSIAALFQVADGAQVVVLGALRGLKDTRTPMIIALVGYWLVGFPAMAAFGFWAGLGGRGIWLGLAACLAVVAVLLLWRFYRRGRWAVLVAPQDVGLEDAERQVAS